MKNLSASDSVSMKIKLISDRLAEEGLRMEIDIMPPMEFLHKHGFHKGNIPMVRVTALIDTGAKTCAIDRSVVAELGVIPYKSTAVKTPLFTMETEVYQLIYKIPGKDEYFPVVAVAADLSADDCKALIGRDFLQYCRLTYDGANESGTLEILK
nr:MAG TPA: DNA damage inducible protein-like protein [Caudoviricetes sp.]